MYCKLQIGGRIIKQLNGKNVLFTFLAIHPLLKSNNQTKEIENEIDIFYNISWDKNFASLSKIFAGFVDFVDSPSCSKVSSHLYFCFFVVFFLYQARYR